MKNGFVGKVKWTGMEMKAKRLIAMILCGMMCLTGCADTKKEEKQNKTEQKEEEYEMQVYRTPTEKELELLEDCNLSSEYMKEIKEKGMSISVQSFVDTAQIMLDYLEEKYDEEFKILGGEIPGVISGDYSIIAYATEGEYAGEEFDVYYRVDEEGNGYCEDGYFAIIKEMEIQEYLQNIANKKGSDIKVIGALKGEVGKEYDKQTKIEQISDEIVVYVFGYMRPEVSEEEFQKQVLELEKEFQKTDFYINYTVFRLSSNETFDDIENYLDIEEVFPRGPEEKKEYDLRYHSTMKPN